MPLINSSHRRFGWLALGAALLGVTSLASSQARERLAIGNATVIPMDSLDRVLEDHTIVVEDGVITWLGPSEDLPGGEVSVIDAEGLFVAPGLVDAHVHLFDETQLSLYLASGITTVLNMSGTPEILRWKKRITGGSLVGPEIFTTGPQVKEGASPIIDTEVEVPSAERVEEFVRQHRRLGYDFLKIWSSLPPVQYEQIVLECRRQGVRVTGHVPSRVGLRGVLASGQRSIAHVEEILNKFFLRDLDRRGLAVAAAIARDDPFTITSTLVTYEMIADTMDDRRLAARLAREPNRDLDPMLLELWGSEFQDWYRLRGRRPDGYYDEATEFLVELTGVLHDAGVTVLAGSDAGLVLANVIPGWSLHRELELLVEAGLSEAEALAAATVAPGRFLEPGSSRGVLTVGAPANLTLLRANPLDDIANTRTVEAVVARGRFLDRAALDAGVIRTRERLRPTQDFLDAMKTRGLDAAIDAARSRHASGGVVPHLSGLLVAAYHRAQAEDLAAAFSLVELACELYPDSYVPLYWRGGLEELRGREEEVKSTLERALELCPEHPVLRERLGLSTLEPED